MRQTIQIEMSKEELGSFFLETLQTYETNKVRNQETTETLSINQAAKRIGIAHDTTKKLIASGQLRTTSDKRRILAKSISDYLNK